jgi:hypothetical protein
MAADTEKNVHKVGGWDESWDESTHSLIIVSVETTFKTHSIPSGAPHAGV